MELKELFTRENNFSYSSVSDQNTLLIHLRLFLSEQKFLFILTSTATVTSASVYWPMTGRQLFPFSRFVCPLFQCSALAKKRRDHQMTVCTWKRAARTPKKPNGGTMMKKYEKEGNSFSLLVCATLWQHCRNAKTCVRYSSRPKSGGFCLVILFGCFFFRSISPSSICVIALETLKDPFHSLIICFVS